MVPNLGAFTASARVLFSRPPFWWRVSIWTGSRIDHFACHASCVRVSKRWNARRNGVSRTTRSRFRGTRTASDHRRSEVQDLSGSNASITPVVRHRSTGRLREAPNSATDARRRPNGHTHTIFDAKMGLENLLIPLLIVNSVVIKPDPENQSCIVLRTTTLQPLPILY